MTDIKSLHGRNSKIAQEYAQGFKRRMIMRKEIEEIKKNKKLLELRKYMIDLREMKMYIHKENLYMNLYSGFACNSKILETTQMPYNR